MSNLSENKTFTDEERAALAKKLDEDLDNFINGLEKRQYTEGWPEDRWQEEMEKHPFFMKKPPEPGDELHPLLEGLQRLKYDPEENQPEELAVNYKEDGNFNFKHKNYRLAIIAYTEAIKIKCGNPELEATILNNRSAAHYYLKNYRSSLRDAELAIKLKPDYEKAILRAINCCYEMKLYEKALSYTNKSEGNEELLKLKQKCAEGIKIRDRDLRKKQKMELKKSRIKEELLEAILKRGLKIEGAEKTLDLNLIQPILPQLENHRVSLDNDGKLIWPVVFAYSEYQIFDFLQQFSEDNTFREQLNVVLEEKPEWDVDGKYNVDRIHVYFENATKTKLHEVNIDQTLGEILKNEWYVISAGTPTFLILVRGSLAEEALLKNY